jgi:rhodanese-related sulfurtransferase
LSGSARRRSNASIQITLTNRSERDEWKSSLSPLVPSIVDLRQPMDIEAFPQMIPGALRIAMEEIEDRHGEIPRDRDVVLYCS